MGHLLLLFPTFTSLKMSLRQLLRLSKNSKVVWRGISTSCARFMPDDLGSGAGKGGGSGGAIRDAGGKMGEMGAAKEEISWHESQVKEHQEDIVRHKKKLEELNAMVK